jgi:hypothetical protein
MMVLVVNSVRRVRAKESDLGIASVVLRHSIEKGYSFGGKLSWCSTGRYSAAEHSTAE